jgi:AraC family transcriptional regulator, regulatory protein of adaptative response / methylated-DNA-[protein]-cysteine methyltransferase
MRWKRPACIAALLAPQRCKPTGPSLAQYHAEKIMEACRIIDTADEEPMLSDLAHAVGMSPYHFHRIFKAAVGVTPKVYAGTHRSKRMPDPRRRSATGKLPAPLKPLRTEDQSD